MNIIVNKTDIERICTYLEEEIESNSNSLELRSLIAEVALIDKQLTNILAGMTMTMTITIIIDYYH